MIEESLSMGDNDTRGIRFTNSSTSAMKLTGKNKASFMPGDRAFSPKTGKTGVVVAVTGNRGGDAKLSIRLDNERATSGFLSQSDWVLLPSTFAGSGFDDYTGFICKTGDTVELIHKQYGTVDYDNSLPVDKRRGTVKGTAMSDLREDDKWLFYLLIEEDGSHQIISIERISSFDIKVVHKASVARGFIPPNWLNPVDESEGEVHAKGLTEEKFC